MIVQTQPSLDPIACAVQADPAGPRADVAEIHGRNVVLLHRGSDGYVVSSDVAGGDAGSGRGLYGRLQEVFLPRNTQTSVRADYVPTRKCYFVHDVATSLGSFAAGAAVSVALGASPVWGGAAMATFALIRERLCQTVGFLTTFVTPSADRNPRPWIIAGEVLDTAGMVLESTAPLFPRVFLPLALVATGIRVVGGVMRGAAQATIEPRQALADNLGEMRAKNGNQSFVSGLVGSLIAVGAVKALGPHLPQAYPLLAAAGAGLALVSMAAALRRHDFNPVNEDGMRAVVQGLEKQGEVTGPKGGQVWRGLFQLARPDRIELGQEIRPLLENPARFDELTRLYAGRNYLLEVREGQPVVVLHEASTPQDRFQAMLQAVYVDQLRGSEEYKAELERSGAAAADRMLVSASFSKTPADVAPLLAEMKQKGWSVDLMRFMDTGRRGRWEVAPSAQPASSEQPAAGPVASTRLTTGGGYLPALTAGGSLA